MYHRRTTIKSKSRGLVRIFAIKQNSIKEPIMIISVDIFSSDFLSHGDREGDYSDDIWSDASPIGDVLKDKPNGAYEIVGNFHHEGWNCGYEYPEYEFAWCIKRAKVIEAPMRALWNQDSSERLHETTEKLVGYLHISPYMSNDEILAEFFTAIFRYSYNAMAPELVKTPESRQQTFDSFDAILILMDDNQELFIGLKERTDKVLSLRKELIG